MRNHDDVAIEIPWAMWNRLPAEIQRGFRLVARRGSCETAQGYVLVTDAGQIKGLEEWAVKLGFAA